MKRVCGLVLFSIGLGMVLMICLPVNFCTVLIAAVLLLAGYNLFCSCK